jgi:hypothetical protein
VNPLQPLIRSAGQSFFSLLLCCLGNRAKTEHGRDQTQPTVPFGAVLTARRPVLMTILVSVIM